MKGLIELLLKGMGFILKNKTIEKEVVQRNSEMQIEKTKLEIEKNIIQLA